jgi:catechol 2,3-dioxygenase-like lactoylglutathione lyase family enzyme
MANLITGIQQIGIGVVNAAEAFNWYNKTFNMNIPLFDDVAEAKLMVKYTAGNIRQRRAIMALNIAGGGGAEIWESKRPLPLPASFEPAFGDLGIYAAKIKCQSLGDFAHQNNLKAVPGPDGQPVVWTVDPYRNPLQIVEDNSWFKPSASNTGGVFGAVIGVSDIEKTLALYVEGLGMELIYDKTGKFEDAGGDEAYRRVLLRKKESPEGAFTRLIGNTEIELVQALDRSPRKIMEGRTWGDLGFIHLCFDTINMDALGAKLNSLGYPFTVDSANSFDMGEAAGRFTYIEDADGTLLEFVETHKVPVLKKLGWYINLKKRGTHKRLPNFMVSALGLGKVKPI